MLNTHGIRDYQPKQYGSQAIPKDRPASNIEWAQVEIADDDSLNLSLNLDLYGAGGLFDILLVRS